MKDFVYHNDFNKIKILKYKCIMKKAIAEKL